MRKIAAIILIAILPFFVPAQVTTADYARAESFLQRNLEKHLYNSWVEPSWEKDGNAFIYSVTTRNGREYFMINPAQKLKTPAFDHQKLAALLNEKLNDTLNPFRLPLTNPEIAGRNLISFGAKGKQWIFNTKENILTEKKADPELDKKESLSPDKKWIAKIDGGNIFLKEKENGTEHRLTGDGTPENGYGYNLDWYATKNDSKGEQNDYSIEVYWSRDSKHLIVPRFDRRNARRLLLYKVDVEGYQSEIVSYERGLAGDSIVPMVEFYVFDVDGKQGKKINLPPNPAFLGTGFYTFEGNPNAYFVKYHRGYKTRELFEIDYRTGNARHILTENYPKTFVDIYTESLEVLYDTDEFIWRSEQDGWSHLYRYSLSTGKLKNQITSGNFYVYGIEHIDKKSGTLWFMAGGADPERDPYQKYLYSISLKGGNMKLLTPQEATHDIRISPDKKFFVDNFSSHAEPNSAVVCRMYDGKQVMEAEKADIADLLKMGWKPAEPFSVLADDGETMLYGLIIKPANFDPSKKYPVIDGTYTGPHTIRAPKTFSRSVLNMDLSLAELGFVVVNIDGRGTAYRSKKFHDVSYTRLGYGLTDHVYVIKKLAETHPYMDITRVGIYGHSAGGYDATRALLLFPDFYKVGVSSAADHDHRMEKIWWPELYQGFPADTQYHNQSNITNAHLLKGDLLIVTGDMDNNVNPSATYKLAGELTKSNKDFEMIVLPNEDHSTCYWNKYFIRKRWDFFVKHLMGADHPKEYKIK